MQRRLFLSLCLTAALGPVVHAAEKAPGAKMFVFKLRAPDGSVGDVTIVARDLGSAIAQVKRKYPGYQVLSVKER
jgi:hypothetical protein